MKNSIVVKKLNHTYTTFKKSDSRFSSIKDFFSRNYIKKIALNDLSFNIHEGKIVGLLGPNGAGKTTLIKLLTGLVKPTSGEIQILGYSPYKKESSYLKEIGVVLGQKSSLLWDLTPYDTFKMLQVIYGIDHLRFKKRVEHLTALLNLTDVMHSPVRALSLGERMKCELIAALIHQPKILFLDEPTIGLDFQSQKSIREFLIRIAREDRVTIIFTSHHLADIEYLCDELLLMRSGEICYQGKVDALIQQYTPTINIEFSCENLCDFDDYAVNKISTDRFSLQCEPKNLKGTLNQLTAKVPFTDISIKKSSLEDAIYDVFKIS